MTLRRAPLEYNRTWQMRLWLFAVFFFLYAPLVALIEMSAYGPLGKTAQLGSPAERTPAHAG